MWGNKVPPLFEKLNLEDCSYILPLSVTSIPQCFHLFENVLPVSLNLSILINTTEHDRRVLNASISNICHNDKGHAIAMFRKCHSEVTRQLPTLILPLAQLPQMTCHAKNFSDIPIWDPGQFQNMTITPHHRQHPPPDNLEFSKRSLVQGKLYGENCPRGGCPGTQLCNPFDGSTFPHLAFTVLLRFPKYCCACISSPLLQHHTNWDALTLLSTP